MVLNMTDLDLDRDLEFSTLVENPVCSISQEQIDSHSPNSLQSCTMVGERRKFGMVDLDLDIDLCLSTFNPVL